MKKHILAFGEILWDLLPNGAVLGGAPFNFAYRVNSLGDRAIMVSRLGCDELGQRAWDQATAAGIETTFIQRDNRHPTGIVNVRVDAQGNPDFTIVPKVAYDFIELSDALLVEAARADCLCFGTLIQRHTVSRNTLAVLLDALPETRKLLDINLRKDCHSPQTIQTSLEAADILKLNEDEVCYLAGLFATPAEPLPDFCQRMMERWQLSHCVVTLGDRGAFAASNEGERVYVPGYEVKVQDTCGAGDAFTAGFIHGLLRGQFLAECCRLGNALGALVATQSGATVPVPRQQLKDFLGTQPAPNRDPRFDSCSP
jgi:fructokinase